jgi:hypothetical protein
VDTRTDDEHLTARDMEEIAVFEQLCPIFDRRIVRAALTNCHSRDIAVLADYCADLLVS